MTEPQKPGEGEPAPYTLPSWIDQAIARSKGDEAPPEAPTPEPEPPVSEDADTAEYPATTPYAPPPRPTEPSSERRPTDVVPHFLIGSTEEKHVKYPTVPETPLVRAEKKATAESLAPEPEPEPYTDAEAEMIEMGEMAEIAPARSGGALPWVIAALFLAAAALVLAYLIWVRPVPA